MEAATVPTQVAPEAVKKRLYRNNTAGWLGVIKLNHRGEENGDSVEPYGTVWLSDAEALLTSRAPRRPEDNPFEEQVFIGLHPETGAREEQRMRPLVLADDEARFVPNERYVPIQVGPEAAEAPVTEELARREREILAERSQRPVTQTPATPPEPASAPPSSGSSAGQSAPPPAPPVAPQGAAAPPVRSEPRPTPPAPPQEALAGSATPAGGQEERQSWVEEPEAPGRVLTGSLGGDDGPGESPAVAPDPTDHPGGGERYTPTAGQAQAAPQTPGAEEHAAAVDPAVGEETGAARPPAQPAPEGEYAQAEEVGSPGAPASDDEPLIGG